jgi:hypothetical protein
MRRSGWLGCGLVLLMAMGCKAVPALNADAGSPPEQALTRLQSGRGVSGAAHVEGGSFSVDVQVGEPLSHGAVQGGTVTAGDAVLK